MPPDRASKSRPSRRNRPLPAAPSVEPVATPSPSSAVEPSPSASAGSGAAAHCSGSDDNRLFFADAAVVLNWTVYCAVLPSGWFVDTGGYRRAGGGRLGDRVSRSGRGAPRAPRRRVLHGWQRLRAQRHGVGRRAIRRPDRDADRHRRRWLGSRRRSRCGDQLARGRDWHRRGPVPRDHHCPRRRRRLTNRGLSRSANRPMRIADFALERYFARWEFAVEHLLCASDVEGYGMADLLALADDETRGPVGEPEARLHGVDRSPASPSRDRGAVRPHRAGRRPRFRRRRGGDLLPFERAPRDRATTPSSRGRATRACTRSAGRPEPRSPSTSCARTSAGASTSSG